MRQFRLKSLILLILILVVAVCMVLFETSCRAKTKVAECDKEILSVVEGICGKIYFEAAAELERLNPDLLDELRKVRTSDPKHRYVFLKAMPADEWGGGGSSFGREHRIFYESQDPTVMKDTGDIAHEQRLRLSVRITTESSLLNHRQPVTAKIESNGAERDDEFVAMVTERLQRLNVPFEIQKSTTQPNADK